MSKSKKAKREKVLASKRSIYLHFLGANKQVTGSFHFFEYKVGDKPTYFFVDAGLDQENEWRNFEKRLPKDITPSDLSFGIISHAHIDHSGYLPRLVKEGFKGPVYCTNATRSLLHVMLPDSGHIQEEETGRVVRRCVRRRESKTTAPAQPRQNKSKVIQEDPCYKEPLYTEKDAVATLHQLQGIEFGKPTKVADGILIQFSYAAHLLGAAIVEISFDLGESKKTICFTGDIGPDNMPLLNNPETVAGADYVICECTYGNRLHVKHDRLNALASIVNQAYERAKVDSTGNNGVILIPAFAVGRVQALLFDLRQLMVENKLPNIPVFVDSPLAIRATQIHADWTDLLNTQIRKVKAAGDNPFATARFTEVIHHKQSLLLAEPAKEPIIIISSSGMAQGGRIVHHLEQRLSGKQNTVLFIGYQARGTLGQKLTSTPRPKRVKIGQAFYTVNATIEILEGYSGHADYEAILRWLKKFKHKPKQTFLVHGDNESATAMQAHITERLKWREVMIPNTRNVVELI
jgi:metallo-beta-lactamase family protein